MCHTSHKPHSMIRIVILYNNFFSTTTIVNSKIPNRSTKIPTLSLGFQNSSQYVSESPNSPNLLSKASFRTSKYVIC